jgi:RsiW-degrading membrane proteinase PrsW (M82 family)
MTTLSDPVAPAAPRYQVKRVVLLVGIFVGFAACGIGVLVYLGLNIGITALLVGVGAAIIPVPVLVSCFLWLDRYEPEPTKYLAACLAWGACVATAVALLLNQGAAAFAKHQHLPSALVAVLSAPVAEESMKALGPLLLFLLRPKAFSGVVDGIVYCGMSATGFAMVENILYLGGYGYAANVDREGVAGGLAGVVGIFVVRIALSGFAHPLFTAMTGIGLGVAARSADKRVRVLAPLAGWLTAMILHGSWNLMATLANQTKQALILLYGYFSVMMPIFFGMVGFALWLRSWEGRLTQRILPEYVRAGWLSPPEVATLATVGRRQSARNWARRVAGEQGAEAMRGFQYAATRLALLRDGLRRGLQLRPQEVAETLAEERALLDSITAYRAAYTGRDPLAPPAQWDGQRYHVRFPDGSVRTLDPPEQPVVPVPVLLMPYR